MKTRRQVKTDQVVVVKYGHVSRSFLDGVYRRLFDEVQCARCERRRGCPGPSGSEACQDCSEIGRGGCDGRVVGSHGRVELKHCEQQFASCTRRQQRDGASAGRP